MIQQPVLYMVIPCYNEEAVLPITAPLFREKLRQLIDEHHDCTLRTASKLKEVFPEYFK